MSRTRSPLQTRKQTNEDRCLTLRAASCLGVHYLGGFSILGFAVSGFARSPLGKELLRLSLPPHRHSPSCRGRRSGFPPGDEFLQMWFSIKDNSLFCLFALFVLLREMEKA